MKEIKNETYSKERSLYHINETKLIDCAFEGKEDGESPLKECSDIEINNSKINLRYPFWHDNNLVINDCKLLENCRASLWYSKNVTINNTNCLGVKAIRECNNVTINDSSFESEEFGWNTKKLVLNNSKFKGNYFLFGCDDVKLNNVSLDGKYSFQYINHLYIDNSNFNTKDAFWHTNHTLVMNSYLKGEYIGWYSKNLTLINCTIEGTQPFCYCKNLNLINCKLVNADFAFENSEVKATISGNIISIKNVKKGTIIVNGSVKEIIEEENCPFKIQGRVVINKNGM